jgi:hypothetical protein
MAFHYTHKHTQDVQANLRPAMAPEQYAAVVGTPVKGDTKPITGHSGDHLQFYIDAGDAGRYQVDVNTQSQNGTAVQVYVAVEPAATAGGDGTGASALPALGVFTDAALSYRAMGLTAADFAPMAYYRIDALLNAALSEASVICAYGATFDDGGAEGKGVHDIHMDTSTTRQNQDGALVVYAADADGQVSQRTWYFFKFDDQSLPG